jgi:hypothetical protein
VRLQTGLRHTARGGERRIAGVEVLILATVEKSQGREGGVDEKASIRDSAQLAGLGKACPANLMIEGATFIHTFTPGVDHQYRSACVVALCRVSVRGTQHL